MFGSTSRPGMRSSLGSLGGDSLGAREYTLVPLGAGAREYILEPLGAAGAAMRATANIQAYGRNVADMIMSSVEQLPSADRPAAVKAIMNQTDPNLYARANKYAVAARAAGASPRDALAQGISAGVREGLELELVKLGEKRAMPKARSLLGLGRCHALGESKGGASRKSAVIAKYATTSIAPPGVGPLNCPPPPGMRWIQETPEAPGSGHLGRAIPGEDPGMAPCGPGGQPLPPPEVRVHEGSGGPEATPEQIQARAEGRKAQEAARAAFKAAGILKIGPFAFPIGAERVTYHKLNAEQQKFVDDGVKNAVTAGVSAMAMSVVTPDAVKQGKYPFAKFKRPVASGDPKSGKEFGLYWRQDTTTTKIRGAVIPGGALTYKEYIPPKDGGGILGAVWNGIKSVGAAFVDVVKEIGKATCGLLNEPGVVEGAQSVAGAAPNPYTVGIAAGATIGKELCGGGKPKGDQGMPGGGYDGGAAGGGMSSMLLPLALVGGAGLLIVLAFGGNK